MDYVKVVSFVKNEYGLIHLIQYAILWRSILLQIFINK